MQCVIAVTVRIWFKELISTKGALNWGIYKHPKALVFPIDILQTSQHQRLSLIIIIGLLKLSPTYTHGNCE